MTIVSFYSLFGTIQSAVLSLLIETNPGAWRLKLNMDLLVIILTVSRNIFLSLSPHSCVIIQGSNCMLIWLFTDVYIINSMIGNF